MHASPATALLTDELDVLEASCASYRWEHVRLLPVAAAATGLIAGRAWPCPPDAVENEYPVMVCSQLAHTSFQGMDNEGHEMGPRTSKVQRP